MASTRGTAASTSTARSAAARTGEAPPSRQRVREVFLAPRVLVGATGQVEVVAGGRIRPRAHLMTIDGDEIRRRYPEDEERARRTATTPSERAP